jgi:hypothetical protein
VLHLAPAACAQRVAHDTIVHFQEFHRGLVTKTLRKLGRTHDVGEENGANSRVAVIFRTAGNDGGPRAVDLGATQESLGDFGGDFDDLFGDHAVRLTMDRIGGFRIGRAAEAENLAAALVEPVFVILDAVLLLRFHIRGGALSRRLPR